MLFYLQRLLQKLQAHCFLNVETSRFFDRTPEWILETAFTMQRQNLFLEWALWRKKKFFFLSSFCEATNWQLWDKQILRF